MERRRFIDVYIYNFSTRTLISLMLVLSTPNADTSIHFYPYIHYY